MSMIYVKDKDGKTYALPNHIIEDFEVSNVRLDSNLSSRGVTAPSSDLSKLQALWSSLELDVTVAELRSILGIDDLFGLPSGVCSGLGAIAFARRRPGFGRGGLDLRRPRLCGGLEAALGARPRPGRFGRGGLDFGGPRVCGGLEAGFAAKPRPGGPGRPRRPRLCAGLSGFELLEASFLNFFSDPRIQNVRIRLKAHELSSYLHETD